MAENDKNSHDQSQSPQTAVESLPPLTLTETPGTMTPQAQQEAPMVDEEPTWQTASSLSSADDRLYDDMHKSGSLHALNPYKLALSSQDIESCLVLENSAFGEIAASREKVSNIAHAVYLSVSLSTKNPDVPR